MQVDGREDWDQGREKGRNVIWIGYEVGGEVWEDGEEEEEEEEDDEEIV